MTVNDLLIALSGAPAHLEVVTEGSDHSYQRIYSGNAVDAERHEPQSWRDYSEYWDEANLSPGGNKDRVFLVSAAG